MRLSVQLASNQSLGSRAFLKLFFWCIIHYTATAHASFGFNVQPVFETRLQSFGEELIPERFRCPAICDLFILSTEDYGIRTHFDISFLRTAPKSKSTTVQPLTPFLVPAVWRSFTDCSRTIFTAFGLVHNVKSFVIAKRCDFLNCRTMAGWSHPCESTGFSHQYILITNEAAYAWLQSSQPCHNWVLSLCSFALTSLNASSQATCLLIFSSSLHPIRWCFHCSLWYYDYL